MAYTFDPLTGTVTQSGGSGGVSTMGGTMTSHIIPDTNSVYDLGSAELKIRHIYLSSTTIYTEDGTLSVGTAGEEGSGGDTIVNSSELKAIAAASSDFADFQARIAAYDF